MSLDSIKDLPESLERIALDGSRRIANLVFEQSAEEWKWAFRYLSWAIILEVRGCPGIRLDELYGSIWLEGWRHNGRNLLRSVVRNLRRRGLLKNEGSKLFVLKSDDEYLEKLWLWLDVHSCSRHVKPYGRGK